MLDEVWQENVSRSPALRQREGLPIDDLGDLSFEATQSYVGLARAWLERIGEVDQASLSPSERVDLGTLEWDLEMAVEGERWFFHDSVLTSYRSPLPAVAQLLSSLPLDSQEARQQYLALLGQVPDFIGALETRVRNQAERGIYVWGPNYATAVGLIDSMISTKASAPQAQAGPFGVAASRLEGVADPSTGDDQLKDVFLERVALVVTEQIDPALHALADYLRGDYADQVPQGVGASQLPDGEAYYRFAVRRSTTMDVTPEADPRTRRQTLVAEMEAEMESLQRQAGFEGSTEAFREALRNDPQLLSGARPTKSRSV